MTRDLGRAGTAVVSLWLAGCVAPITDGEIRNHLQRVAGLGSGANVLVLNAESEMAAWVLVTEARSNGPIVPSRRLALGFADGARKRIQYVVGGPYPQLNNRALLDAFTICKESRLPGLVVVLVSPKPPSEELVLTAEAYKAKLVHRDYGVLAEGS